MVEQPMPVPPTQLQRERDGRRVKGTLVAARLRFLAGRGPGQLEATLERLTPEDRDALRGMILPSSWYPFDLLQRLEAAAAAVVARGDRRRLFREMGRFSAQSNLGPTGVQRAYVRYDDPHFLLSNLPRMYVTQHTDGRRTYERTGDTEAVVRSFDAEAARPEDCLTTLGWLERAIECSGGRAVQVEETRCRATGAPHCEFRCSWR